MPSREQNTQSDSQTQRGGVADTSIRRNEKREGENKEVRQLLLENILIFLILEGSFGHFVDYQSRLFPPLNGAFRYG